MLLKWHAGHDTVSGAAHNVHKPIKIADAAVLAAVKQQPRRG
jgi:hypothetical protein